MTLKPIDVPCPRTSADVRDAWGTTRRIEIPHIETDPAATVTFHPARPFPVYIADGRAYAPVRQGFPSHGSVEQDLSQYVDLAGRQRRFGSHWSYMLSAPELVLAVVNGTVCDVVAEPHWRISYHNAHRGDRPCQIRLDLSINRRFPRDLAPSDPPTIAFPAHRRPEAEALMARMLELHPRTSPFPSHFRCDVHRPGLLAFETLSASVGAVGRGLVASTHKALPALPRAALESWMALRRLPVSDDPREAAAFASAAAAFAPLLRLPPLVRDVETDKWLRRARVQADLLALRLAAEPDLVPEGSDDLTEALGPRP